MKELLDAIIALCNQAKRDDPGTEWGNHDRRHMAMEILALIERFEPKDNGFTAPDGTHWESEQAWKERHP